MANHVRTLRLDALLLTSFMTSLFTTTSSSSRYIYRNVSPGVNDKLKSTVAVLVARPIIKHFVVVGLLPLRVIGSLLKACLAPLRPPFYD